MHAIVVRCPQCHASLKVDDALASTRCEYCGTHARVQRTTIFGARVGLPPPESMRGMPVAIERKVRTVVTVVLLVVGVAFGLGIFLIVNKARRGITVITRPTQVRSQVPGRPPAPGVAIAPSTTTGSAESPGWNGGGEPVFVDVNGDGARDPVGLVRYVRDGDRMHVGAIDAKSGASLWESETLGTYTESYQGRLYSVGPRLLFAHPRGELHAFDAKTGARAWTRQLGERVRSMCDDAGKVSLSLLNGQWLDIELASGQVTPSAKPGKGCVALHHDGDALDAGPAVRVREGWVRIDGMSTGDVLELIPEGVLVAAGSRSPGTSVPMLARIEPKGRVRWKVEVPAENPFDARAERHTIATDRTCAVYAHGVQSYHVTCFGLADGTRRWDREVTPDHVVVRGLSEVDGTVFLSTWGKLYALDAATGAPRFTAGR